MTAISDTKERKRSLRVPLVILCLSLFLFAIFFGSSIKEGVVYGIKICVFNIIPTLFPFFILSDLWSSVIFFRDDGIAAKCFEGLFGISGKELSTFLLGNICGFPLGIKSATEKYSSKTINKSELEALCAISNNPSAAFVISGVGMGLFKSPKYGIILYLSVLLSAVAIGVIFKANVSKLQNSRENIKQSFDLVKSIKAAGYSSIVVSSYIIFFSSVIGVVGELIKNKLALSFISSFLEVSSACSIIAEQSDILGTLCLPLISFALAFSGLSVFMQAFSFLPPEVSKTKYLYKKMLQGIISAAITFFISAI